MMQILSKMGAIIIGTSDSHGGIYEQGGLDVSRVTDLKKNKKSLAEYQ